jgi:hypothetical protein
MSTQSSPEKRENSKQIEALFREHRLKSKISNAKHHVSRKTFHNSLV